MELKPCPFCGGKAVCYQESGRWLVECAITNACDIHPEADAETKEEATKKWNRRANEEE